MKALRRCWLPFLLASAGAAPLAAQTDPCLHCRRGWAYFSTVSEIVATNILVAGYHRYVWKEPDYGIRLNSGQRLGWDASEFFVNQFGHPFHGGLYFSSARVHGFDYWAGLPFTLFGSLTFEMFMDPEVVSNNDLLATTIGGAAFGESTYRLSSAVLQSRTLGGGFFTGLLAIVLNPIVGFHEIVDGPSLRTPGAPAGIAWRFNVGGRVTTTPTGSASTTVYEIAANYGDYFSSDKLGPFDAFEITGRLNLPEPRPLADFHIVGVLTGGPAGGQAGSASHMFGLFQHLDYYHPEGTQYGGQSVGVGSRSRWNLGDELRLRVQSDLNWMIVGAVSSEFYAARRPRDYDHGTGASLKLGVELRNSSALLGKLAYAGNYLHTLNGPSESHLAHFIDANIYLPLFHAVGVGIGYQWYTRRSHFSDLSLPDVRRSESEIRVYMALRSN